MNIKSLIIATIFYWIVLNLNISPVYSQGKNDINYTFYYGMGLEEGTGKSTSNSMYGIGVGTGFFENNWEGNLLMNVKDGYMRDLVDSTSIQQHVKMSALMLSFGPAISTARSNFFSGVVTGVQCGVGFNKEKTYPLIAGVYSQININWPDDIGNLSEDDIDGLSRSDQGRYALGLALKPIFNFIFDESESKPIFSPAIQIALKCTIRGTP